MSTLLDTNILLRLSQLNHPLHQTAVDALTVLRAQGEALYLVSQNLYEFWVASTRPIAQNGLGMTARQAEAELAVYNARFLVLDDTPAIRPEWEVLVKAIPGRWQECP